jgi:hypothetical protein
MSHPGFSHNPKNRFCWVARGGSPLPGFGVSPKNPLFPLLFAAAGGEKEEGEVLGTPQTPAGGFAPCTPSFGNFFKSSG